MIRNIVLLELKEGAGEEDVERIRRALLAIDFPERENFSMGRDIGVREDNMDVAILADFPDVDSYQRWNDNPEHNRVRAEVIAPVVERIERCQYSV